ncbi:DNA integrity scanning diadenylate cyclase DisA [Clostridium sp. D2Q-14]|uniref:DNA integrity scanning diadenylate cyclase DisA n=1 Tax=Anaeromonas gelatinilytica TaxID=2683194 RepID=UPI00193C79CE|nr:DNA integrity scanning diadenylate cyclase DisA [Anaeromonas gelatinilytica]MBS4535023.1 DNA integrity scanning diadenylate cyclase DisA [Anaeromonas gelatinilytica]
MYQGQGKENIFEAIKMVSPGTVLREALENIVRAKTGALIVVADSKEVMETVDGGFNINSEFIPAYLYELAKMDGAIILNHNCTRILYANTQLIPRFDIDSKETGTRHRTAERVAKQTNELVISISERRNIITLYKGEHKYVIREISNILNKANQAIQTLEKYKVVLNQTIINLSALEFEDLVTIADVTKVLQRTEMVRRIAVEIEKYILELGNEGRLISMQLEELTNNVEEDGLYVIMDYERREEEYSFEDIRKEIKQLSSEELLEPQNISYILGYGYDINSLEQGICPRGYRILSRIPRLPSNVLENLISNFETFQEILKASTRDLDKVEGIGEVRARTIKDGLRRFQEQSLLDRHI